MPAPSRWVMVPGLGLTAAALAPTIEALTTRTANGPTATVAVLPGYGVPARRREELAPRSLGRRLVEHRLDGDGCVLLGHSASCQVVAHAAALAGGRVTGLVLLGPTTDPRGSSWPALARRWLSTARHEPPGQVPTLVRQYRRTGLTSMLRAMQAARHDRIDLPLSTVRCPVLVVRGVHDRIAPPDWADTLAATAPHGVHVTLPAGGHMIPLTHPALVAAACAEHIGQPG